jgi:hypothetical protein
MPATQQQLEDLLLAANGTLTTAQVIMVSVQQNWIPPGPPNAPQLLQNIANLAARIQAIAGQLQGGPVGAP